MKRRSVKSISFLMAALLFCSAPVQTVLAQDQETQTVGESMEAAPEDTETIEDSTEIILEETEIIPEEAAGENTEAVEESTEAVLENLEEAAGENAEAVEESTEAVLENLEEAAGENAEAVEESTEVVLEEAAGENTEAVEETAKIIPDDVESVQEKNVTSKYVEKWHGDFLLYENHDDNTASIGQYGGTDVEVIIPAQIDGYTITEIDVDAFACENIQSISLPEGLIEIGDGAFYNTSLLSIEFPSTLRKIGKQAFHYSDLRSFSFAGDQTVEVGEGAFAATCMESIIVPANIKDIPSVCFGDNLGAKSIVIEEGVETIGDFAFQANQYATFVKIPSTVTTIGENAFTADIRVEHLEIAEGVKTLEYRAFNGFDALTAVTLPKSITSIGKEVFRNCNANLVISCYTNTCSHKYAVDNGFEYILLDQPTYTISYELGGGENHIENPVSYTSTTKTLELYEPTRKGYTFKGWFTDAKYKNEITQIKKGSSGNLTLYAKWSANRYQIVFNGNKNTNGNMDCQTIKYNSSQALSANRFARTGYTFKEWNTRADGSGTSYKDQEKVKNLSAKNGDDITLYAQWTANKYQISFNGNGATSGSMDAMKKLKYGKKYTLTANAFKRSGYTFTGWNTREDGTGKSYNNKAEIKGLSSKSGGKVILYAQWKKTAKTYTITYSLNKGKNNKSNPTSYTKKTATIKLQNPTRKGYTFKGWYSDKKYKNKVTQIKKGSTGNITLYAKWTANKYTIKFNGNGATSGSMKAIKNCQYNKSYTLSKNTFKRKGYTFSGWNTKKDGTGKTYKNKAEIKNLTSKADGTVTLYAQWKKK